VELGNVDAGLIIRMQCANVVMMRSHIVERGIASENEVEAALQQLRSAEDWSFKTLYFVPFC
jgi:hypothetical protein